MVSSVAAVLANRERWGVDCDDATRWAESLPDNSVHCVCTSPPYFALRDYGVPGQMGLESSPAEYVAGMVRLFRELRRALHPSGTVWVNVGASSAGSSATCGTRSKEGSAKRAGRMFKKPRQVGPEGAVGVRVSDMHEPFALRDDLTPEEVAYVLSELAAAFRDGGEPGGPE